MDDTSNRLPHNRTGSLPARVRVWDLPVRIFHWLMAFSFAGAYLTAELDDWRIVHITLGYTMAALVVFRLFWGFFGTLNARFSSFVRGPQAILAYLRSMASGRPQQFTGHNPAGAVAILLMLSLVLPLAGSGWLLYEHLAGEWMEEVHELLANALLAVVLLHILGVVIGSILHRENLAKAMITGYKRAAADDTAQQRRGGTAALLLLAVVAFWWWQWDHRDAQAGSSTAAAHQGQLRGDDD